MSKYVAEALIITLHENTTKSNTRGIGDKKEWLVNVRQVRNWVGTQHSLDLLKSELMHGSPDETWPNSNFS